MATDIKSILNQGSDFLKKTDKKKLIKYGSMLLAVIVLAIIITLVLNRTVYTVLYSNLSAEEAGTIMTKLEELGVSAKAQGTDTILVPEEQADKLRIELASEGYPNSGLNYDFFSKSSSLTTTNDQEITYKQYQLQENMRTTISKMDKVKDCIVIVNLATTSSFVVSSATSEASVSILVEAMSGEKISDDDAKAIAQFALKCVPELKMENISIVDTDMHYYDITSDGDGTSQTESSTTQQELTEEMKNVLREQVLNILVPAVGSDNIAVSVNVKLNFDSQTKDSVEFSPPVDGQKNGLIVSSQEVYDAINGTTTAKGQTGSDSNGVSAPEYQSGSNATTEKGSYDNTYNYELNRVETKIEKAKGNVEDLSVSVLINSEVKNVSDNLKTIEGLVANSIGVDKDYITVGMLPFVEGASGNLGFDDYLDKNAEIAKQYTIRNLIIVGAICGTILLLALLAFVFFRKKNKPEDDAKSDDKKRGKKSLKKGGDILDISIPKSTDDPVTSEEEDRLLRDLADKKSDGTKKVEDLMDRYPEAVAQIVRNWLTEDLK